MNLHHPTFSLFTFHSSLFTFHHPTFFLTLFTIHFSLFTFASDAFNLKGRALPNGNIAILGYDNAEREAVLLTPDEYAYFTNAVAYLNTFKDFRRQLHGEVVKRETDVERRVLCIHHADGYVWEEPMRRFSGSVTKPSVAPSAPTKPDWMTDRQWAAKRRKAAATTPKTLNATFAPGGKLISTESEK